MEDVSSGYGAHIDADATPGHPQEPDSGRRSIGGGGSAAIPTIHTELATFRRYPGTDCDGQRNARD
eukprot:5086810-Pyramimonas_sp.AAC.1